MALVATLLAPTVAAASVSDDVGDGQDTDMDRVVRGEPFPDPSEADRTSAFAVSPALGRGYFFLGATHHGWGGLVSVDLRTGQVVASTALSPLAWSWGGGEAGHAIELDEAASLVYVPYQYHNSGAPAVTGSLAAVDSYPNRRPCLSQSFEGVCAAGAHVLNAETLERVGDIPFSGLTADGVMLAPLPLAIAAAPEGRLLTLFDDRGGDVRAPFWTFQQETSPYYAAQVGARYVAQFEAASGRMEWIVRLDSCRGPRETRESSRQPLEIPQPGAGALHVEMDGGSPAAVWVGCHTGSSQTGVMVRLPLDADGRPPAAPVTLAQPAQPAAAEPEPPVRAAAGAETFAGPNRVISHVVDGPSGRVLMKVVDSGQVVWWVFDTRTRAYIGTIGVGDVPGYERYGLDDVNGLLYSLSTEQGLLIANVRTTPLSQALKFPQWAEIADTSFATTSMLMVLPGHGDEPSRVYSRAGQTKDYHVLLHHRSRRGDQPSPDSDQPERQSLDLAELEGVTSAVADGAARGFGARALFVGGVEGLQRVGPADAYGTYRGPIESESYDATVRSEHSFLYRNSGGSGSDAWLERSTGLSMDPACIPASREVTVGFVGPSGPAVVDASGARGGADPVVLDASTRSDAEAPVSRCTGVDWEALWGHALFGQPPVEEPAVVWPEGARPVECVSGQHEETSDSTGDTVAGVFAAQVACDGEEASGFAYTRGLTVGDVNVAEALSSFRIYRDPGRGIVSRVESVARGIQLGGSIRIGTVRGTAESWANGRAQPLPDAERESGYHPNCDYERTAGTCFQRHLFGVSVPGYSCGPCIDEQQVIQRLHRSLGSSGSVRLRDPDPELAVGSADGSAAAVQKTDVERFADLILNTDLLQTTIPVLEIIRYAPANRPLSGGGPRGRQIYQFAGVEVSSAYAIQCLLVYDEETNTCSEAVLPAGSLTVSLTDAAGAPLAGGTFEVRADVDADGVVGLVDELVGDGACVTAADGTGTCTFTDLQPGAYLVSQTAAPTGYSTVAEPWLSEVAAGEARTVTFTNTPNISTVEVTATDESGDPVEGAVFAVFPDPDADGKIAPDTGPAATCTTDTSGVCAMDVPAGSYVLAQTGAPDGLASIDPVAFTFASGGQTAAVAITNSPADPATPDAPPAQAAPVVYTAPPALTPTDHMAGDTPPVRGEDPPAPSITDRAGGTIVQVIRAPGDALRLLTRDPKQAIAWTAALALFALALMAVRRRQLLGTLTTTAALAHAGRGPTPTARRGSHHPIVTAFHSGAAPAGATALADPPVIAGAAASRRRAPTVSVVVATTSPVLASIAAQRLDAAERCQLTATVDSLDALRDTLARHHTDVLVVDLALPTGSAEDICDVLDQLHPAARTIGLIPPNRSFDALITRGVDTGLAGMLVADGDLDNGHLGYTVRAVTDGKVCYGPTVQAALLQRWEQRPTAGRGRKRIEGLSDRELEVARLAAAGMTRSHIAEQLFLASSTVKWHLRVIRAKLGVTNPRDPAQLSRRLAEHGLLEDASGE